METGQCNIGIRKERGISSTCLGELGLPACWPWLSHRLGKLLVTLSGQKGRRQGVFPGLLLVFVLVGSRGPLVF